MAAGSDPVWQALGVLFKAHPWHGVPAGPRAPEVVTCFIEIVPTDTVKYELDKMSGLLKVDRPQKYSNVNPTLYGFIPQTLCAEQVAARCVERTSRAGVVGDGDPIDICVLTERAITHGNILVEAVPIGGLRMIDGNEADDKIIAVLYGDPAYGAFRDIGDLPRPLRERLRHYFLTYKQDPDASAPLAVEIPEIYGRDEAHEVIRRSQADYGVRFAGLEDLISAALKA
jgi:inorganic pyrophosphatase